MGLMLAFLNMFSSTEEDRNGRQRGRERPAASDLLKDQEARGVVGWDASYDERFKRRRFSFSSFSTTWPGEVVGFWRP